MLLHGMAGESGRVGLLVAAGDADSGFVGYNGCMGHDEQQPVEISRHLLAAACRDLQRGIDSWVARDERSADMRDIATITLRKLTFLRRKHGIEVDGSGW